MGWKIVQKWDLNFPPSTFNFKRTDTWDYFCDGLIKSVKYENLTDNDISRTHFKYNKLKCKRRFN